MIQLVPEAPINLLKVPYDWNDITNYEVTTDESIRFTWEDGANSGGAPVLDYDIYYDQGAATAQFILLAEAVTLQVFQTTV